MLNNIQAYPSDKLGTKMTSNRIKNLIFEFLLNDLYKVEIIYYRDSIWFIDRENRYWYFEYHKVDKHLWWRWSHFTTALTMFSMEAEKEQYLLGELVNMILTKKQKLEEKYPNKIFKTVGSVMNFGDKVDEVLNYEVEKTAPMASVVPSWVDKVLNNEVETTIASHSGVYRKVDEVLNCEVETTEIVGRWKPRQLDDVLDSEVETTAAGNWGAFLKVDEVLNCEVETTELQLFVPGVMVDEILNCEVETTGFVSSPRDISMGEVLDSDVKIRSGELTEENEMMDKVLSVDIETIGYSKTHRLRPVTGALDYNDNPIEIKSIRKLKGESPLQDIIVSQILDESDKVTDKLKMKEDDYVKTYSHDVYMCDHLVQNVLDIGVNSIHYDTHNHQPIVDGILKKA